MADFPANDMNGGNRSLGTKTFHTKEPTVKNVCLECDWQYVVTCISLNGHVSTLRRRDSSVRITEKVAKCRRIRGLISADIFLGYKPKPAFYDITCLAMATGLSGV